MIGESWEVDVTVGSLSPALASVAVVDAIEAAGWLWIPRGQAAHAEQVAHGAPWCTVELTVQPMSEAIQFGLDDEIVDAILRQLRAADVPCRGITVARKVSSS